MAYDIVSLAPDNTVIKTIFRGNSYDEVLNVLVRKIQAGRANVDIVQDGEFVAWEFPTRYPNNAV